MPSSLRPGFRSRSSSRAVIRPGTWSDACISTLPKTGRTMRLRSRFLPPTRRGFPQRPRRSIRPWAKLCVMDRVCREGDGLFPSPAEIKLSCSCPDWADMCKHVAAALYGIGARLDEKPQLLFVLRGVDENELIANAGTDLPLSKATPHAAKVLDHGDVGALFGLEMAETAHFDTSAA